MMNHRLRNNLFGTPPAPVEEENTKVESRAITDYIREFDFEVHLDDFENSETSTSAIFVRGDRNTSILNARIFKGKSHLPNRKPPIPPINAPIWCILKSIIFNLTSSL